MKTMLLDADTWDLVLTPGGDIAVAEGGLNLAQDAASAIRLFEGELYFDTSQGVPYFDQVLGYAPPVGLMKEYFNRAALTVEGVATARTFLSGWTGRTLTGQVQVTDESGNLTAASF